MVTRRCGPHAAPLGLLRAAAALLAPLLASCTLITDSFLTNDFSGDPFPIGVDTASGAVLVGMRPGPDAADRRAVLDLLSPFTLVDSGPDVEPSLTYVDLTLLGAGKDGSLTLPRARFPDTQLLSLHPCSVTDPADPGCRVGTPPGDLHPFDAVIGAATLAGDAIRLRLDAHQIFVLADVGGSDRGRTLDCDAVFGSPYRGGGTLVLAGTELPFGNRRITLRSCLGPDVDPHPDTTLPIDRGTFRQHGTDALFVVSTGIGISILGRAAYDRYVAAVAGDLLPPPLTAVPFDQLTPASVSLPSGEVQGRRATIDRIALVAASTSNALSPCRQLYAHRLLTTYKLTDSACKLDNSGNSPVDCPCKNGQLFCGVPAVLELTPPTGIDVLVVDDTEPTLQALRTELRPDQPEVDGILGTGVLRGAEIDVDYPHDRLLGRCPGAGCLARPALAQEQDLCPVNRCIPGATQPISCSSNSLPEVRAR
jgi:hypothetical protein